MSAMATATADRRPYEPWTLSYASSSNLSRQQRERIPNPPGFTSRSLVSAKKAGKAVAASPTSEGKATLAQVRSKRAWELALSPAKSIPMQAFVMYMTGGGVQIFSMMSVGMLMKSSVSSMLSVNKAFAPFVTQPLPNASTLSSAEASEVDNMLPQKALFLLCQALLLGVALYKCHSMGLLPTASSDWLAFRQPPVALEWSASPAI